MYLLQADFIEPRIGYPDKVLNDWYLNEKYENVSFTIFDLLINPLLIYHTCLHSSIHH